MWFHHALKYLGLRGCASTSAWLEVDFNAEHTLDAIFVQARAANPNLWAQSAAHAPTRQLKFESFALWLAVNWPSSPRAQRTLLEAAIERLAVGLREAGVGDMSVSKEIRTLAGALNGRLRIYNKLFLNNNLNDFLKVSKIHTVTPAEAKTAWAAAHPKPVPQVARQQKKALPSGAKPIKARQYK